MEKTDIIESLAKSKDTLEYIQTQHLSSYDKMSISDKSNYLDSHFSEKELTKIFNKLVTKGAKRLSTGPKLKDL